MTMTKRYSIALVAGLSLAAALIVAGEIGGEEPADRRAGTPAEQRPETDVRHVAWLRGLASLPEAGGIITEQSVSAWASEADYTISSLLPGDARALADLICDAASRLIAGGHMPARLRSWTVRVFLPVGNRPAATCQPR